LSSDTSTKAVRPQRGGKPVGAEHGHLPLDPAAVDQPLDAAQAGGGRDIDLVGQRHIADAGIVLQGVQQHQVDCIEFFGFHELDFIEIKFHYEFFMK
jgi:hypothetical protein